MNKLKQSKVKNLNIQQKNNFEHILNTPKIKELMPEPARTKALSNLATRIMLKWLKSPKFQIKVDTSEVQAILLYSIDYWIKYKSGQFDLNLKKKQRILIGVLEVEDSNKYPSTPKEIDSKKLKFRKKSRLADFNTKK